MVYRMPLRQRFFILAAALLLCGHGIGGVARADTSVQVRVGWDGFIYAGRWNLVFLTLADDKPRNVTVEIHTPYDSYHTLRVDQVMTVGPTPRRSRCTCRCGT